MRKKKKIVKCSICDLIKKTKKDYCFDYKKHHSKEITYKNLLASDFFATAYKILSSKVATYKVIEHTNITTSKTTSK